MQTYLGALGTDAVSTPAREREMYGSLNNVFIFTHVLQISLLGCHRGGGAGKMYCRRRPE